MATNSGALGAGELPHDVIGLHGLYPRIVFLGRTHPEVLLVVEDLGVGHVVFGIDEPLGQQKAVRIANVSA